MGCPNGSAKEEKKNDKGCNSPMKSTFAMYPKCNEVEEPPLIDPINLKPIIEHMDIPNELNNPLPLPYISTMSPQNKRKVSAFLSPIKRVSFKDFCQ